MRPEVSVVIGFRNWGLERLRLSIHSIHESLKNVSHEVIVSDFGSDDEEYNRGFVEELNARYVYTESDFWSRSAAINIGVKNSQGRFIFCTDADMIFSPEALDKATLQLQRTLKSVVLIQCRDLPEEWDAKAVADRGMQWQEFSRVATLRPRWGMGGLIGFRRDSFDAIRGLDERMHTYGGEDLDLAQRFQRAGNRIVWLSDSDVRMYHIWHPSSLAATQLDPAAEAAVKFNKSIVEKDPTIIRNLEGRYNFSPRDPLVSVVISTYNRADMIHESISSVLAQTFQDFELIIIDDGSNDNTEEVVRSFGDDRIVYQYQENGGISKARNHGTDLARGKYIAVHDDDDMMVPDRLAISLRAIRGGIQASFGSWINFDDETGELFLNVSKKNFNEGVVWGIGPAPGHSTWLVETELMRKARYDESLSSAVDHNLATRLVSSGVRWAHTGAVMFLRRKHARQISESDEKRQTGAALMTRRWTVATLNQDQRKQLSAQGKAESWPTIAAKGNEESYALPWLTDHLVSRTVVVKDNVEGLLDRLEGARRAVGHFVVRDLQSGQTKERLTLLDASWRDLATLRTANVEYSVSAVRRSGPTLPGFDAAKLENDFLHAGIETVLDILGTTEDDTPWLVFAAQGGGSEEIECAARFEGLMGVGTRGNFGFEVFAAEDREAAHEISNKVRIDGKPLPWILNVNVAKKGSSK